MDKQTSTTGRGSHGKNSKSSSANAKGRSSDQTSDDLSEMTMSESDSAGVTDASDLDVSVEAGSADETGAQEQAPKSVGTIISESLNKESQMAIDRVLGDISSRMKTAREYAGSNPGEATLIAVTAALAGWVLLNTKPGRTLFDAGAERFVPEITKWVSNNFSGRMH